MFCSKCGCELNSNDVFCSKCGNKVYEEKKTDDTPKFISNNCGNCGAALKKLTQSRYLCEYCGSEFFTSNNTIVKSKISEQEIVDVFFRAAKLELENKFYEELQCLLSISEKASDNATALVKIGRAYRRNNMLDKAVEYYERAIDLNSVYANAYCNLGAVFIFTEEFVKAEKQLRKAIKLMNENRSSYSQDDYAVAHSNCAIAVGKQGRIDEAKELLKIAEANGYSNGNTVRKMIGIKKSLFGKFF